MAASSRRASPSSHKQAQRGAAWIWGLAGLVLLGAILGGAFAAFWTFRNVDLRLILANQPATVTIPEPVDVTAKVLNNLDIVINDKIHTRVPVNQTVSVPVNDTLRLTADFDATVPIRMTVPVHDSIPIDQSLDVDTVIQAQFLGDTHDIHIRGKVPVKARVPINLAIPVDKEVRLKFSAPVDAKIKQNLTVPLNMVIDADIPIHSEMSVPVKSELVGAVTFPKKPHNVIINYSDLRLPLRTLVLSTNPADAAGSTDAAAPAAAASSAGHPADRELGSGRSGAGSP